MIAFSGLSLVVIISPFLKGLGFCTPPLTAGLIILVSLRTPGSVKAPVVASSFWRVVSNSLTTSSTCFAVSPTLAAIWVFSCVFVSAFGVFDSGIFVSYVFEVTWAFCIVANCVILVKSVNI